ncbi:lipoprotein-releasing ABC transporter ATP-binding protein LolD [Bowmanella sp. JS7-9]|uniref:Lipoprotein-releasing system ATP-binding protein LolD n=1 Tax=Pseudobowmanella zhangzhouensis TaxID=1537679 RepID=A0ABW1XIX8_9ALTE|nr:lipoprotein-releasing ABC transporter ATP-binding protein LolD [Bowmanella sp. JS7-9]TBX26084.1 ABC transporter [Bowmanella sp. JS7-9]
MSLLRCIDVSKSYQDADKHVQVLKQVNLSIEKGQQVAILGTSGSGKSTLLHILGALDKPSSGQVIFDEQDIFGYSRQQQAAFRNQSLGFVYQFHHLLPEFSALENVAMPLLIGGESQSKAKQAAANMLERVGLGSRVEHKPSQLSGGERQRVAIARALINQPKLVLADEPTGNLDEDTGEGIFQLLGELKTQLDTAFVVVTHDRALAARMDKTFQLHHGVLEQVCR